MTRKILILIFTLMLPALFAQSQDGYIRGKVLDAKTGETLIGVTVAIVGTTQGTTTDFDGNYSLSLAPGTYSIRISYISYQPQTFENVKVEAGGVEILNANLTEVVTELQEVEIKAKASRNTEAAIQLMQKNSASMLDGISARQISKLGDDDAAAALKRVTGVTVQENKYVFVRGLGDRYTKITLNGADIPALDPEKNTVQMDIFPSNIIENIVVHKTFTPDLPGESTGGYVNVVTKDFPEKFTLQFSASFGYNQQANFNDKFLSYTGGDTDWLGMDDGTRDIPSIAKQYLDQYGQINYVPKPPYTTGVLNEISESFNKSMSPGETNSGINQSYKFSVGNQVNFLKKTLGYNIALGYSNKFKYYDNGIYGLYDEGVQPDPRKIFDKVIQGEQSAGLSGLLNLNLKLNNLNKVGFRFLRSQKGTKIANHRSGFFYYEGQPNEDRILAYLERNFSTYQLHGKHVFSEQSKLTANWLLSYTQMNQNEPDLRFFEYLLPDPNTMRIKTNDQPARFYRQMKEGNYSAKLDFEWPIEFLGDKAKIKFGGAYTLKDRLLEENKFEITTGVSFYPTTDIHKFLTDYIISESNQNGYYYIADQEQDNNNSYEGMQHITGGYAMIDMPVSEKLRIITGLRVEDMRMEVNNLLSPSHNLYKNGKLEETDFLPSLSFIYELSEQMNLRLAGSRTLARPAFREIGTNYYDYKRGIFVVGNQDLQRATITNADLRWEWFFKAGEKVSLSGFYKHFQDPIEPRLAVNTQNIEIKYENTDEANVYGLEFEFRKTLDFTGLKNFTFGGNLSLIQSIVQIPDSVYLDIITGDPTREDTRPMFGQAPYIVNAYLGYRNTELALESNIGFNVTGEKLYVITKGGTPYIFEQPYPSLNFNISKGFGKERSFNVELGVDNILDSAYEAVHHFNKPEKVDKTFISYSLGRTFKLGLKYKIN